jgi:hypothetical protein
MIPYIGSNPYKHRISMLQEMENIFMEKRGERKDNQYFIVSLSNTKKNENETIRNFNKIFNQIVQRLHADIKPLEVDILNNYLDSFESELDFHITHKDAQSLRVSHDATTKNEKNRRVYGK